MPTMWPIAAAFGILAIVAAHTALADPAIGADTNCASVVDYLDRKDTPHAQEAYRVAKQLMADLDTAATAKGQASLLAPLTKERAENVIILVLESCRDEPQQTLGKTASDTYDGILDLRDHPPAH
jgi:hypothetical protein